jgi:hypothetical protein
MRGRRIDWLYGELDGPTITVREMEMCEVGRRGGREGVDAVDDELSCAR